LTDKSQPCQNDSLARNPDGSIFISVIMKQSGKLVRKPSGGERAWFLEEESEPRNKWIFLAGENTRADESVCLTSKEIVPEIGMLAV